MKKKPLLIALASLLFFILAGVGLYAYLSHQQTKNDATETVVAASQATIDKQLSLADTACKNTAYQSNQRTACRLGFEKAITESASVDSICKGYTAKDLQACISGFSSATIVKNYLPVTTAAYKDCSKYIADAQGNLQKLKDCAAKSSSASTNSKKTEDATKNLPASAKAAAAKAISDGVSTGVDIANVAKAADSTCKKLSSAKEKACVEGYFAKYTGKSMSSVCKGGEKSSCEKGYKAADQKLKADKAKAEREAKKKADSIACQKDGIKVSGAWIGLPGVKDGGDGRGCIGGDGVNPTVALVGIVISLATGVIGLIMVLMIVISGLEYTLAGPDVDKTKNARNRLESTATAFILLLLMWAIIQFILPPGAKIWS